MCVPCTPLPEVLDAAGGPERVPEGAARLDADVLRVLQRSRERARTGWGFPALLFFLTPPTP